MSDRTSIEWTDASWNPIRALAGSPDGTLRFGWHCEHKSEGCRNCYAEAFNRRLGTGFDYKPGNIQLRRRPHPADPPQPPEVTIFLDEKMLLAPLKWRKPRKIFVCSMTDLFADFVTDEMIDRVFAVMALCPSHVFQVLTKRPERMRRWFATPDDHGGRGREIEVYEQWRLMREAWGAAMPGDQEWEWRFLPASGLGGCNPQWPLPNVWLGISVEDQAAVDERIPMLLDTPATVRWLSCEPLLGPVNLNHVKFFDHETEGGGRAMGWESALNGTRFDEWADEDEDPNKPGFPKIDWVVAGGESGPGARPMHPDWARSLRDQCAAAAVPFLFKQWGAWGPDHGDGGLDHLDRVISASARTWVNDEWREQPKLISDREISDDDVYRVGKKHAGRLLDGVQHDGYPS